MLPFLNSERVKVAHVRYDIIAWGKMNRDDVDIIEKQTILY